MQSLVVTDDPIFIIEYDLRKERDYDSLIKALKDLGAVNVLESHWWLRSPLSIREIYNRIRTHIDEDDGLLVVSFNRIEVLKRRTLANPRSV